jgi:hypothetical protein
MAEKTAKEQQFFNAHVQKYGKPALLAEYYECLIGASLFLWCVRAR